MGLGSSLLDTLLNVTIFAFIGILIWLYLKKDEGDNGGNEKFKAS